MSSRREKKHWIFSNKPPGFYDYNKWDMGTSLKTKKYYLSERERNRGYVKTGDIVYMRIYGDCYSGMFEVAADWKPDPKLKKSKKGMGGYFQMRKIVRWKRQLPQNLIMNDLSNMDRRSRIVRIKEIDSIRIEAAQKVYERLGLGAAGEEIVVLEKGLEEAIKPNLKSLGLKLADGSIQQQFSMGPGVGRSDLICLDEKSDLVVIELKRGRSSEAVVGQVLKYVGYMQENIAKKGQKVHGWIVTGDYDEGLKWAAKAANVRVLLVRLP